VFVRRKFRLRFGEVFFDEVPTTRGVDLVRFSEVSHPVPDSLTADFHTILVDLTEPENPLFQRMKKDTRQKVRRAQRDGVGYRCWMRCGAATVADFCGFYAAVAAAGGVPKLNRARLAAMAETRKLFLSRCQASDGSVLVWHAYYVSGARARIIHSVSIRAGLDPAVRNSIGRANRYHHWRDMLELKATGIRLYDFGGWSPDPKNRKRQGINRFKEEFGGVLTHEYNCLKATSLIGKLAVAVYGRLSGYRQAAPRSPLTEQHSRGQV
jgi:hypothetical protein